MEKTYTEQTEKTKQRIIRLFNLTTDKQKTGNASVTCPLHDDLNNSASVNLSKGVFQCFSGCGGYTLKQLLNKLDDNEFDIPEKKDGGMKKRDNEKQDLLPCTKQTLKKFVDSRKITSATYKKFNAKPIFDRTNHQYGYIVFNYNDNASVARSFINHNLRYLNSNGEKSLFNYDKDQTEVFLVEGIYDLMSLYELGYKNVVSSLSSVVSKQQAYLLRGKTVYILFDADYAGWHGSIDASKLLYEVGANPIILELKEDGIKDINEFFIKDKKGLKEFIEKSLTKYDTNDSLYVKRLFSGKEKPLNRYSTGIKPIDDLLVLGMKDIKGGLTEGVNLLIAETEQGKSTLALAIAANFAENNCKTLYVTYEITNRQCWSRVASRESRIEWSKLEIFPERIEKYAKEKLAVLSTNLKIASGWTLAEIRRVSKNYQAIIIDYIQRMPGITSDPRTNVNMNGEGLSDIARDEGKILLIVSSINRNSYGDDESMSAPKDSGNLEYTCQTMMRLKKMDQSTLLCKLVKNTRGPKGTVQLRCNLGHLKFK